MYIKNCSSVQTECGKLCIRQTWQPTTTIEHTLWQQLSMTKRHCIWNRVQCDALFGDSLQTCIGSSIAHLRYGLCCSADNAGELCEGEADSDRPVHLAVLALLRGYKDRNPAAAILSAAQPQHSLHHMEPLKLECLCSIGKQLA